MGGLNIQGYKQDIGVGERLDEGAGLDEERLIPIHLDIRAYK